ncbi:DUF1439 domain-containing protein [Pseudoxanthomonas sp. UTMC 1351]|uniref:DUF1439 domain-containing protein n=1 Tax=Pseudoxanthomonas sp. UTMC 1351 TaxID=2695853 RepID=UPI0034CFB5A7
MKKFRSVFFRVSAALLLTSCAPFAVWAQTVKGNEVSVTAAQVQQHLSAEFPQDYDTLGGLLTLTLSDPQLSIPAEGQRLMLGIDAKAASGGGTATPIGRLWLSSGLRFDPQQRALLLDQPTLDRIDAASPGQQVDGRTQMLINLWLSDYAKKEPLYQLDPATAALLGDLQVVSTNIENGRVVVRFNRDIGAVPGLE